MAGATRVTHAPYPTGNNSTVIVRIGGYIAASSGAATIIDNFLVPFDCFILGVFRSLQIGTEAARPDAIRLLTVDDSKTIVADLADPSADIAGVAQVLHANIIGYQVQEGDVITLDADTAAAEDAVIIDTLLLRPVYG